jgi:integral membrane protein
VTVDVPEGDRVLATPVARFRAVAVTEAVSWAGLLLGMFFKYVVVHNAMGVHVFGTIHGVVFLGYLALAMQVRPRQGWNGRTTFLALLASIPPFGSVVFERWATRTGRLAEPSAAFAGRE